MTTTDVATMVPSGLALLPTTGDKTQWTEREAALMESLGLRGTKRRQDQNGQWYDAVVEAPRAIVEQFLSQCRRTGLDPFARQIYCIERGGKWGIQASIDGFRLVAERTGTYRGQTPAEWCGPDGVWTEVWLKSDPPAAARIGIYRDGFAEPLWAVATYEGYCPRNKKGDLEPKNQWSTNPANQLAKCAEMLGLRKAFPQDLSGIYGSEEMDSVRADGASPEVQRRPEREPVNGMPEPSPEAIAAWQQWKEAIDAAPDKQALAALWEQAKDVVGRPIPGDPQGRRVGDYFMYVAASLPDTAEAPEAAAQPQPEADEATGEVIEQPEAGTAESADEPGTTEWATAQIPNGEPAKPANDYGDDTPF